VIVCIIKQPVCVLATDSAQFRAYDYEDFKKSTVIFDAQKFHVARDVIVVEGGNTQVFAAFLRRVAEPAVMAEGVEYMIKRGPTLLNRSARAWETEIRFKWPKVSIDTIREARHTHSIIAGYSPRKKRILAGAVADNPALNNLAPENGFLVAGGLAQTRHLIETELKGLLFGPNRINSERETLIATCMDMVRKAAEADNAAAGCRISGGPIRVMCISGKDKPEVVKEPIIEC